jgi:hypothetical protein
MKRGVLMPEGWTFDTERLVGLGEVLGQITGLSIIFLNCLRP